MLCTGEVRTIDLKQHYDVGTAPHTSGTRCEMHLQHSPAQHFSYQGMQAHGRVLQRLCKI